MNLKADVVTWRCLDKHKRPAKRAHKIRTGIEPVSSGNRSALLTLNCLIFLDFNQDYN